MNAREKSRERVKGLREDHSDAIGLNIPAVLNDGRLGAVTVVSSFGAESVVLLHFVSKLIPGVSVLFLDTDMHFAETLSYKKTLGNLLDIRVRSVKPDDRIQEVDPGNDMHKSDPDQCCYFRKVLPFESALGSFDTYITGRKRYQTSTRSELQEIEAKGKHVVVNPLASWDAERISKYIREHNLPEHPLIEKGYRSIGCKCCTVPTIHGEHSRSGRWSGFEGKLECGIHRADPGS